MSALPVVIELEADGDADSVSRLHARAFGPGRYARTAYRLREGTRDAGGASFIAHVDGALVGSVRIGRVRVGDEPALMLGPIAVDPRFEGRGIGSRLMAACVAAARDGGHGCVILIGDAPYYRRFGFAVVPPGRLTLPGPADPARLLWLALREGATTALSGTVRRAL